MIDETTPIKKQAELAYQDRFDEIRVYRHGAQTLVVRDWKQSATLYKTTGTATRYAEMAAHDGPVLVKGKFREIIDNGGLLEAHHPYTGRTEYVEPDEAVDVPSVLLTEVPQIEGVSD